MQDKQTGSNRLARNSAAGLLRYVITVPILLATTPFILHRLGPELFGIWALFAVVTAYAELSDLGISSGLVRFVAQYAAQHDEQAMRRAVSTVMATYLICGGLVAGAIALAARPIALNIFRIPSGLAEEATFVIAGAGVAFLLSLLLGVFSSLIQGLQRMELWNGTLVVYTIVDAAGAIAVLLLGWGLRGLVLSRIFAVTATGLLNCRIAHRILPGLRLRPADANWGVGREIVLYSLNILVGKAAAAAREPLNKTVLSRLASLTAVSTFDLAARLANQARGVFSAMLIPLLPAASGVQAAGGEAATRRLFYRSTRYVLLVVTPAFGGLIVLARPIIHLWIGPGYGAVALTLQALLIVYLFMLLASPAYIIMEGIGLARVSSSTTVLSALLNLVLSIALGVRFGYFGIVLGYCLSMIMAAIVTLALFQRHLAVPVSEFLAAMPFRALLIDGLLIAMAAAWVTFVGAQGLLPTAAVGMGYALLYIGGTLASGSLDPAERAALRHYVSRWRR